MKHTIMGFQQEKLIELGLDIQDAAILRYFIDFKNTDAMKAEIKEDKVYYWVVYEAVEAELPMLGLQKRAIMKRFLKLRDVGVLTHYTKKTGGTYSFFGIGERYLELITSTKIKNVSSSSSQNNEPEGVLLEAQGCALESIEGVSEKAQGCASGSTTNNPSTKRSIINIVEKKNLDDNVKKIIDYLNKKTGKNFKANTNATLKLIKARLKEGFTIEDFERVVDNMAAEWTGTKWEKYLVPTTLFAGKFETYLNLVKVKDKKINAEHKEPSKPIKVIWEEM